MRTQRSQGWRSEGAIMIVDFDVFDADNHYYEATDAFIRHLPPHRSKLVQWANVDGKQRMIVDNKIFRFIPNPTFDPVARPGCLDEYFRGKRAGDDIRQAFGELEPINPAYRDPEARVKLMDTPRTARLLPVPDARCRCRGSAAARSRRAARRVPRVQRVDARRLDVQLRRSDLRRAVHRAAGPEARRARGGVRARERRARGRHAGRPGAWSGLLPHARRSHLRRRVGAHRRSRHPGRVPLG